MGYSLVQIDDLRQIEKRLDAGELAEQLAETLQEHRPSYGDGTTT